MNSFDIRRFILRSALLCAFLACGSHVRAESPPSLAEANRLLTESDRFRGALNQGLEWNVKVSSNERGVKQSFTYHARAKARDAYVRCTAPAKNSSDVILFNDRSIWFYKPGLRRPLAISPRQRLVGQAANGDIAATYYSQDYKVEKADFETVDGNRTMRLELKAKRENTTYDRLRYWIDTETRRGIKAEFLTLQGKVFKRATFEYKLFVEVDDKKMPFISRMIIRSAKYPEDVATLEYSSATLRDLNESIFNVNNIMR